MKAITFDFWNTLVVDHTSPDHRASAWLGILEGAGYAAERQAYDEAVRNAWQNFEASWGRNERYTHLEAAIDILDHLGHQVPPEVHDQLVHTFVDLDGRHLELTPNVGDAIRELKAAGIRIGIICDVGWTPSSSLRQVLDKEGLLEYFDHWSFSDDVGHYKPAPEIFEHALDGLGGVDPSAAAHIGDLRRTDVAGAKAMGITSIRYTGVFDDPPADGLPEADHVIGDHLRVPSIVV